MKQKNSAFKLFFILFFLSVKPWADESQDPSVNLKILREPTSSEQEKYAELAQVKSRKWQKTMPPVSFVMENYKRTIIHIHSVYSHDACDKKPFVDGKPNETCFQDQQRSFCELNTDIVFLTEHAAHMGEYPFEDIWHLQPNDSSIFENGERVGIVRTCADGHQVHIFLGAENKLMPVGLVRHPEALPATSLSDTYSSDDLEAVKRFREAGALVGMAHTEGANKSVDYLKNLGIDFLEIYNIHAEFLILLAQKNYFRILGRLFNLLAFTFYPALEPDLLFLSLQTENQAALDKWAGVALSQHITGTAGTDAHQNVTHKKMFDGERFDSYRRIQRWFSNYLYAPDPTDRKAILKSIRDGRNLVVFEVYGMPKDFNFSIDLPQGVAQMGDMVEASGPYTVRMHMPKLIFNGEENTKAELEGILFKATPKGWVEVARGTNAELIYQGEGPGVYRAQVSIRPNHLQTYIPGMWHLNRKHVWLYSNPIWIK